MPTGYTFAVPTIARNLRDIRRRLELTQQELADLAGVNQNNISKWEKGRIEPTVTSLLRVARATGCTLDDFVRGIDTAYDDVVAALRAGDAPRALVTVSRPAVPSTPAAYRILEAYEESDEQGREVLMATARALRSAARRHGPKASTRGGHRGRPTSSTHSDAEAPKRREKK